MGGGIISAAHLAGTVNMPGIPSAFLVAGVVFLSASVLSARAEPVMTIDCHIRATAQSDALHLEAIATGESATNGTYRFEVFKTSSTGTSQNVQSGEFRLEPHRDEVLSTVILDGSAMERYRARLTLDSAEFGSVSCVSP
jgi:hypothetical protein